MSDPRVVERLILYAEGALDYDRHNPDVGMGLFPQTAVKNSVEVVEKEGSLWTGQTIKVTQEDIDLAIDKIIRQYRK